MKRMVLSVLCALMLLPALADEGMWLPSLIGPRVEEMRAKGFRLTADDIYSVNESSMKDAVVLFGGFCTGELVSEKGLVLTNHHCGYDAIQQLSTVEHDYLTHGFWALSADEELPAEGLYVRILVRMEDVTERIAAGERAEAIVAEATGEVPSLKASVERIYYGNQHFLFVYRQYDDVRLVGAPPSSIGKFGGDTDNWIWPRHTGDFSVFRVYAGKDNEPAAYAPDNVPYRPRRHFKVSVEGIGEGDFTMIYGFPGNTQEYILSDAVDYIAERSDPAKIDIRTQRLEVMAAAQAADPAVRLFYAALHANTANAWKKWQGELLGIRRLETARRKRAYEADFEDWARDKAEFADVVGDLKREYARIVDPYFALEIMKETLLAPELNACPEGCDAAMYGRISAVDSALYRRLFRAYWHYTPRSWRSPYVARGVERLGSIDALADSLFRATRRSEACRTDKAPLKPLFDDLKATTKRIDEELGPCSRRNLMSARLEMLYTTYMRALMQWDRTRAFFPDANLTLRVSYGRVEGYRYADGCRHLPFTSLEGIIEKDNPEIYDYDIPQRLREVYASKDYGRWAVERDGVTTVPVCFLATNHTTGGNSGSPVLNGRGELIGINFDRTWLSTMSDIEFDPSICRNIAVDIRYVLFVIDRIGGAGYLVEEMGIR